MKLNGESIVFEDLSALELFYNTLNLQGILRLSEDLKDNAEKILIKEGIPLKPSTFEKLNEIKGSYQEKFSVKINKDLTQSISAYLAHHAGGVLKEWAFLERLYNIEGHRYHSYIQNAFKNKRLAVACFILLNRNPNQYRIMITQALLCLAIIMYRFLQIRRIHLHSFLAGLLMDIGDPDGMLRQEAASDRQALARLKKKSSDVASSLGVSSVVIQSIVSQESFDDLATEIPEPPAPIPGTDPVTIADFLASESEADESTDNSPENEAAVLQITEALKFARYIWYLRERLGEDEHSAEEISFRSAYSAQKGLFHLAMVEPILKIFKEYELEIRAMMKVAEQEQKCLHLPSAWAYPKPRATQMICRFNKRDCPLAKPGWDLTVISPAEAYGWIGTALEPGQYMKCQLEDDLKGIFDLIKKK